jgi:hypothetical protein
MTSLAHARREAELKDLERDPTLSPRSRGSAAQVHRAGDKVHPGWVAHPYLPGCLMSEQWKRVMEGDAQPGRLERRKITTWSTRPPYELVLPLNFSQETGV